MLASCSDETVKILNLCHEWLKTLLPFILAKTSRVNYGILSAKQLADALAEQPLMPRTRRYLAVPYMGKDVPSKASEYAHPDVVIGLTQLSYRYEGLRPKDFHKAMGLLREQMEEESGPHKHRTACQLWIKWVRLGGGRVRGTAAAQNTNDKWGVELNPEFDRILPLQLIEMRDADIMDHLYQLLGKLPEAIEFYLVTTAPLSCT